MEIQMGENQKKDYFISSYRNQLIVTMFAGTNLHETPIPVVEH